MQETWVRSLIWYDSTCGGATKLVHHNCWGCALEPWSHNHWACVSSGLGSAMKEATAVRSSRTAIEQAPFAANREKPSSNKDQPFQHNPIIVAQYFGGILEESFTTILCMLSFCWSIYLLILSTHVQYSECYWESLFLVMMLAIIF